MPKVNGPQNLKKVCGRKVRAKAFSEENEVEEG